jgi:hypothetical protein
VSPPRAGTAAAGAPIPPLTAGSAAARAPIPPFTHRHEELRSEIGAFVAEDLCPHVGEWEREGWFPNEVFARMGELGLLGLKYPREYGGRDGDHVDDAVLSEELSRCGSGGVAAGIGAHVSIATPPVARFGTTEQKERFLAPAIRGERIAALGITEPGTGSDVAGIRTFARRHATLATPRGPEAADATEHSRPSRLPQARSPEAEQAVDRATRGIQGANVHSIAVVKIAPASQTSHHQSWLAAVSAAASGSAAKAEPVGMRPSIRRSVRTGSVTPLRAS